MIIIDSATNLEFSWQSEKENFNIYQEMPSATTEDILVFCWQTEMGILTVYHQMSSAITEDILKFCWQT